MYGGAVRRGVDVNFVCLGLLCSGVTLWTEQHTIGCANNSSHPKLILTLQIGGRLRQSGVSFGIQVRLNFQLILLAFLSFNYDFSSLEFTSSMARLFVCRGHSSFGVGGLFYNH